MKPGHSMAQRLGLFNVWAPLPGTLERHLRVCWIDLRQGKYLDVCYPDTRKWPDLHRTLRKAMIREVAA